MTCIQKVFQVFGQDGCIGCICILPSLVNDCERVGTKISLESVVFSASARDLSPIINLVSYLQSKHPCPQLLPPCSPFLLFNPLQDSEFLFID